MRTAPYWVVPARMPAVVSRFRVSVARRVGRAHRASAGVGSLARHFTGVIEAMGIVMGAVRRVGLAMLVALSVGLGLMTVPTVAAAAPGDIGHQGPAFSGLDHAPTADKAQSKLWFHDGRWWANMFDDVSRDWHIFWLDRSTNKW